MKNQVNITILFLSVWILNGFQGVKACNAIRQEGPGIQGTSVRLMFKPSSNQSARNVKWKIYDGHDGSWLDINQYQHGCTQREINEESILDIKLPLTTGRVIIYAELECKTDYHYIVISLDGNRNCGVIRHVEPAINGRYVRFVATPRSLNRASNEVVWNIFYEQKWITIERHTEYFNKTENNGQLILDVKLTIERVYIYAEFGCRTPTYEILLDALDIQTCGKLYLEPKPFKPGADIKIRYFPHRSITQNPRKFMQTWRVINGSCKGHLGCVISEVQGTFKITQAIFYNDPEYVLEIMSISAERDGTYVLQCDVNQYTDGVEIVTPVRPSLPIILNQHENDKGESRIVGAVDKYIQIECETHNGTNPVVTMYIDNGTYEYQFKNNNPRYSVEVHMSGQYHGKRVRCEVNNIALETPLFAETTLYVTFPPGRPIIKMGDIKEGHPVDVSCSSEGGRPTPSLKLNTSNIEETTIKTKSDINQGEKNVSTIHLDNMERSWNGQTLTCCTVHSLLEEQCSMKTINYLFTPEAVSVEQRGSLDEIKDVRYTLDVMCTFWQFSARCKPEWKIDTEIQSYSTQTSPIVNGTFMKNYTQTAYINVTKSDNRKQLTCWAKCEEFSSHKNDSITILLPYEPIITLDIPTRVNVSEGETFVATCTADSYPEATVTWYNESMVESPESKACGHQSACLRLEPVNRNHNGRYYCVAKNKLSHEVQQVLTVTVQEPSSTSTEQQVDNSSGSNQYMIIIIALSAVVAVVIIIVVIVIIKKKRGAAGLKPKGGKKGSATGDHPGTSVGGIAGAITDGDACYASIGDNDTYAKPIPKTQRPTASTSTAAATNSQDGDTYSTPLPKSQRANAATGGSSQQTGDGKKEMIYADLDLDNSSQTKSGKAQRKDGEETEYVAIDFSKKADPLPPDDDTTEEKMYANQ